MKIGIVADSHFDEHSRFAECVEIHDWIAEDGEARGVALWLHAGDVYERKSTPLERRAVARWVQRLASAAPVVLVRGNHDAVDDLPLLERLDTEFPVHVYERFGQLEIDVQDIETETDSRVAIAMLGWPQRAHLHAMLPLASKEQVELAAGDALRDVLRGLGTWLDAQPPEVPRILLAHAMVRGSRVSTGQPLVGCDFELGLEDLALAKADFYALGHIHMENAWDIAGAPAVYPGSPRRTSFGELEPKGYIIAEFDGRKLIGWRRVETPCTPMLHVGLTWAEGGILLLDDGRQPHENDLVMMRGAEVRVRYAVAADQREAAKAGAAEFAESVRAAGAVNVKVEEVVRTETRARAPAVAKAATVEQKLEALWDSKGFEPGERRTPLMAKVNELEGESNAA